MKIFTILKGESERIPGKNFVTFGDQPLFRHLCDALFPLEIYVNCDKNARIAMANLELPENMNVLVRDRRHEIWECDSSHLGSPVEEMFVEFTRDFAEDSEEVIVLTHVTSPFLEKKTLLNAVRILDEGYRSVHSVAKVFDFAWIETEAGLSPINFDSSVVARTQDLSPVVISKGAFFMARAGDIIRTGRRMPPPTFFYTLSAREAVEIDFPEDLDLAKQLLRGQA